MLARMAESERIGGVTANSNTPYSTTRAVQQILKPLEVLLPMNGQKTCQACGHELSSEARFCPGCGKRVVQEPQAESRSKEILNLRILYVMAGLLVLAVLFPPWESPPGDPPAYLGMHFILSPPEPEAVVSRILQTVELVTLAIGGMYLAWLFREKP